MHVMQKGITQLVQVIVTPNGLMVPTTMQQGTTFASDFLIMSNHEIVSFMIRKQKQRWYLAAWLSEP
jgi:hypothetical protein